MNLRCFYCQTPFTVGRAELLAALQRMDAENLHHYDAHCPRCRRANSVSRQRMEMFYPNWRQAAQEQTSTPAEPVKASAPAKTEEKVEKTAAAPAKKRSRAASKSKAKPAAKSSSKKTTSKSKK